jgi:hypothetical protein
LACSTPDSNRGVEYRLAEGHSGTFFLHLQEAHVERRVVRNEYSVAAEIMEGGQHHVDVRLTTHHVVRDAVDAGAFGAQKALWIYQLIEIFVAQEGGR